VQVSRGAGENMDAAEAERDLRGFVLGFLQGMAAGILPAAIICRHFCRAACMFHISVQNTMRLSLHF